MYPPRQLAASAGSDGRSPAVPTLLVSVCLDRDGEDRRLEEMRALCRAAGLEVVAEVQQRLPQPNPKWYVGSGKVREIHAAMAQGRYGVLAFDRQLTPLQLKCLQEEFHTEIRDRTSVILGVFASRARSHQGKLQVQLARLRYELPRLTGWGPELSRLGGDRGTRGGPGEPLLIRQRRRLRREMRTIEDKITALAERRATARMRRARAQVPTVGLVGYTNAGKSTLLNHLSGAQIEARDELFSTLDPTTRAVLLPDGRRSVFVDTVGFIQDLPKDLLTAFKATIEEATTADLLVHLVDLRHPDWEEQRDAVSAMLWELGCGEKPVVLAYNKADLVTVLPSRQELCPAGEPHAVISAVNGEGIAELLQVLGALLARPRRRFQITVPYARLGAVLRALNSADVHRIEHKAARATVIALGTEHDRTLARRASQNSHT